MADEDWKQRAEALGQAVIARRVELGHRTRESFAQESGLTVKTLGEIERGVRPSYGRSTLATIDQVLRWPAGTARALLNGEPAPPPKTTVSIVNAANLVAEFATFKGLLTWIAIDDSHLALMLEIADLDTADMWEVMKMIRLRRQEQLDQLMVEVAAELKRRGAPAPNDPRSHEWVDEWIAQRRAKSAPGDAAID